MKHLSFRENELFIEDVRVLDITEEMFSPFYVYSKAAILNSINTLKQAFASLDPIIAFSAQALDNLTILKLMHHEGLYIHAASLGQFMKASAAGIPRERVILDGVARTDEEITKAVYEKPFLMQVGAMFELEALKQVTEEKRTVQDISLLINLGIDPGQQPHKIRTAPGKFGITRDGFERALSVISDSPGVRLKAIGANLGSQITEIEPYIQQANMLVDLYLQGKAAGHELGHLDIGGGFSIDYEAGEAFDIEELAGKIIPILSEVDGKIIMEPGRYITGGAGLLITQVLGTKLSGTTPYIFVDAAMNDLIRTQLYEGYHEAVPLAQRDGEEITADIVGSICEPMDVLGFSRPLVKPRRGDFLAFLNTGAYCASMASNYNGRRRAAEVLVDGDDFTLIRHRETWEDLYKNDIVD